ncbi:hypothetical protein AYO28_05355 [Pseudomonas putida]|uniref:Uncharacterized protein n=1 Tax=Pseudomonas putida TaxID=303 RepID=A0A177SVU8_PSEPU|nr:hypothetical protein AYO28_05355 [Pseudomonas putida]
MGNFQAFLGIFFQLHNISTGLGLAIFQRIEQCFQFANRGFCLVLRLGFTRGGNVLKFQARLVQFLLSLATLFFQLGEQFFRIGQRLRAGIFQMLEQAARELLQQVQRRVDWLLVGRHGFPPG